MSYSGNITLTQPAANRVFQRNVRTGNPAGAWIAAYNLGWGAVPLAIAPTLAVAPLEYQVRDAAQPASTPLLGWTSYAANLPSGAATITLTLPARAGWYLVDLRANGDPASVVTTNPIGVGEVIAATGQSLATDFWSTYETGDPGTLAANGVTPSPYGVCLANWEIGTAPPTGTAWTAPADGGAYKSTFAAEFLRLAVLGSGVNCALIGYAYGGEPISSWAPSGGSPKPVWTYLTTTLDNALGIGRSFGTFIWSQGHNDARLPTSGVDGDLLSAGAVSRRSHVGRGRAGGPL